MINLYSNRCREQVDIFKEVPIIQLIAWSIGIYRRLNLKCYFTVKCFVSKIHYKRKKCKIFLISFVSGSVESI